MKAHYAAIVTLVVSLAVVAVAVFISSRRSAVVPAPAATSAIYRVRSIYFPIILIVALVTLVFTLPLTPYPGRPGELKPEVTVQVTGQMWSWTLAPSPGGESTSGDVVLPVGKVVEFDVSSQDVNHNFGIYNSAGELIAQVQAMPGYTNRLTYTFDTPGQYHILCLEYCGVAHHLMTSKFEVR